MHKPDASLCRRDNTKLFRKDVSIGEISYDVRNLQLMYGEKYFILGYLRGFRGILCRRLPKRSKELFERSLDRNTGTGERHEADSRSIEVVHTRE